MTDSEKITIGRYTLYERIASGGMATVHLARLMGPVGFARVVAIKRLHPHLARDPDFTSRFLDEARLAARIRHPNVVSTLDVEAIDDELFLVMDYVDGESLGRLVRASSRINERVPIANAASIIVGVLHGLHAAHEARSEKGSPLDIIHRDVSPQNVMVGVDGVARVLDFGVAKAAGQVNTTEHGVVKGKIAYMPPEQLRLGELDRRVDTYAAAVVLWEALAMRRLFEGENQAQVITQILETEIAPPSKYNPDVSPELDEVVLRGCSKKRDDRFDTALDMADAIEAATGIASQRTVGLWVQRLAEASLGQRARAVAEIESETQTHMPTPKDSRPDVEGAAFDAQATEAFSGDIVAPASVQPVRAASSPEAPGSAPSQLSTISASAASRPMAPKPRSSRNAILAGIAGALAIALLVAVVALLVKEPAGEEVAPASAALPTSSTPVAPPPSAEPAAAADSRELVAESIDTLPVESAEPDPAPPPAPAKQAARRTLRPTPRPASKPAAPKKVDPPKPPKQADCDPPYVIDARGKKKFKMECL